MSDHSVTTTDIALLRDILDLSHVPAGLTPSEAMSAVLDRVEALIGCDGAVFHVMDGVHHRVRYGQECLGGHPLLLSGEELRVMSADPRVQTLWQRWWTSNCSLPERSGRDMVATLRTWYSERQWREHWMRRECTPFDDQCLLGYPTGRGSSMRIMAPRVTGSPFGTREITLLELLLPHLKELVGTVYAPHEEQTPGLTERQEQILQLVQVGMTNRGIARALGLSEATVRKHLEHIYARLGVLSRTQAVTAYFGPGGAGARFASAR